MAAEYGLPLPCDRDAAPSDLQYLTDENIAEIGAQGSKIMTLDKRLSGVLCRHGDDPHREDETAGRATGLEWCAQSHPPPQLSSLSAN